MAMKKDAGFDSDDAAAKMVAVIVAGLVAVAGVGYFAYTLSDDKPLADASDDALDSAAHTQGDDDEVAGDPPADERIDEPCGDCGDITDSDDGEDGGDGGNEDNGNETINETIEVDPITLYLGATTSNCNDELLVDLDPTVSHVTSCTATVGGGQGIYARFDFHSEQSFATYAEDGVADGEAYLKIQWTNPLSSNNEISVALKKRCGESSQILQTTRMPASEFTDAGEGWKKVTWQIKTSDHPDPHYQWPTDPDCKATVQYRIGVDKASSMEFQFLEETPMLTTLSAR